MSTLQLGVFFMLLAALSNATMGVFVKLIGQDQSTVAVIFSRFLFGFFVLLPWFLKDRELLVIQEFKAYFLRALTTLFAISAIFFALRSMPIVDVLVLNNTFPLFLPILVLLFRHKNTRKTVWFSIALGFVGVILVLQPNPKDLNAAAFIALASGVLGAAAILQIRLMTKNTSPQRITFWFFLISIVITGCCLPFAFKLPSWHTLLLLIAVGITGAFYQLFLTLGLKQAPARILSPILYATIIFAGLYGWLIWSHTPNILGIIGITITIIAGILTIVYGADN